MNRCAQGDVPVSLMEFTKLCHGDRKHCIVGTSTMQCWNINTSKMSYNCAQQNRKHCKTVQVTRDATTFPGFFCDHYKHILEHMLYTLFTDCRHKRTKVKNDGGCAPGDDTIRHTEHTLLAHWNRTVGTIRSCDHDAEPKTVHAMKRGMPGGYATNGSGFETAGGTPRDGGWQHRKKDGPNEPTQESST